ncbi:MAG TPA: ATP-binding protein [Terriglobales bacterium]|jgi:two-component system nitrogen regulation sensor histidine kinase NtrY|nr:ATP-binding protein [Terriglobales bacterium]
MIFRRKLLGVFALAILVSVAAVALSISSLTRAAFEKANEERSAALVAQFRREFNRRGEEVAHRVENIAASDATTRMALALTRGSPDYSAYLNEAGNIANNQQLDFLEFVDSEGAIVSSAQSPAKFGYKETPALVPTVPKGAFLKMEELADGAALGLFAVREVNVGEKPLFVLGGRRIDKDFLASLELPAGMRAMFYQNLGSGFSPEFLIDSSGAVRQTGQIAPIIQQLQHQRQETTTLVHWSSNPVDDETIDAIPLNGRDGQLLGVLLIGNSRRPYVELRQHIHSAALLSGTAGILLAVLLSGWASARVTRPLEQLARAAHEVASGNWNVQVEVTSSDELGELAEAFNGMTRELLAQREHLLQAERVAAWRELARRLAHELKNPLFPLQLTVENLLRARQQSPQQFEEIFQESSSTLLAEIANLKAIVSRFSEFSRMPQPRFQQIQLNDVVQNAGRLFQAQLSAPERTPIECRLELAEPMVPIAADPDLLHRALSNLVLNAMDAMPNGGTLTLRTRQHGELSAIEVSDTGTGLTPEECQRLFTPYYTSKPQGTGLGLAIVQSVISDHGGRISVDSESGRGTTFVIELPRNADKLQNVDRSLDATAGSH